MGAGEQGQVQLQTQRNLPSDCRAPREGAGRKRRVEVSYGRTRGGRHPPRSRREACGVAARPGHTQGAGRPRRTGEKAAPCAARRGRSGDRQCAERRRSAENAGGVPAGAARRSRVPSAGPSSLAHARHRNPHPSAKGEEPVLLSGALILLLRTAESASGWRPRHRTPRRTVRAKGERTP